MDSLPPELLHRIGSLVANGEKLIAKYSTISRAWQRVIEDRTFSHLSLVNDKLHKFESAVLNSAYKHRRVAVRRVDYSIILPSYDDHACGRFERQSDRQINDQAFSKAIAELFAALKITDAGDRSKPIDLHLRDFYSAMDFDRRDREKLGADRLASSTGKRHDLFELRYQDSYLQLLDLENIPQLHNVVSLNIDGNTNRKLAPATVAGFMSKLPNLIAINGSFWDRERRRPDQRRQLRSELSTQLAQITAPERLRKFSLNLINTEPGNSNFVDADIRGSMFSANADDLSTALRLFSQAAPCLTEVDLSGPISLGPDLFGPLDGMNADTEQRWQKLEEFIVELSGVRPDGGWYIELDPRRRNEEEEDDEEDDDEEEVEEEEEENDEHNDRSGSSSSGYDSSDSFFAVDQLPPDSYGYEDERRDARLNGDKPSTSNFRTAPTLELEALFLAAARATTKMPALKFLSVGVEIRPSTKTGGQIQHLEFEYVVAGVEYMDDGPDATRFSRLYWDVPHGWRMNQKLESQWLSLMGKDGIVRYNEW